MDQSEYFQSMQESKVNRHLIAPFSKSQVKVWLILFVLINLCMEQRGGTNPLSRFAALCGMVEDHSFRIDPYQSLTVDWAKGPDGHYYSNKAPGPVLLAYPLFWLLDQITTAWKEPRTERDATRLKLSFQILRWLSILLQVLPFVILVAYAIQWLEGLGVPFWGLQFVAIAMLFGNTASLFMNTYFGHGLTAVLLLGSLFTYLKEKFFWTGFLFGFSVLSDYGVALLGIPLLFLFSRKTDSILNKSPWTIKIRWLELIGGGIAPALLFFFYHTLCFGGPFTLPYRFQNPEFVQRGSYSLWGVISLPKMSILWNLVFGLERGILWTQPWVFVIVLTSLLPKPKSEIDRKITFPLSMFSLAGGALLLIFNASFGGWHGGSTPGPRYLSSVFPILALLGGVQYSRMRSSLKTLAWLSLSSSLFLFLFVFASTSVTPPLQPLWDYYLKAISHANGTFWLRSILLIAVFFYAMRLIKSRAPFKSR